MVKRTSPYTWRIEFENGEQRFIEAFTATLAMKEYESRRKLAGKYKRKPQAPETSEGKKYLNLLGSDLSPQEITAVAAVSSEALTAPQEEWVFSLDNPQIEVAIQAASLDAAVSEYRRRKTIAEYYLNPDEVDPPEAKLYETYAAHGKLVAVLHRSSMDYIESQGKNVVKLG